jgi:alkylhydroperoxidase family enzyme
MNTVVRAERVPRNSLFRNRERAALAWTESLTLVTEEHVPDSIFHEVGQHFSDEEIVNSSLAIVAINGWNRLLTAFRGIPGK